MKSKQWFKAIIWLHLLRLSRYKYGFINMILIDTMWYMIFILGALMFVPRGEFIEASLITFWGIMLWIMLNNWVWLISGWTWFALAAGLVDEHIIHNVNPLVFIGGRFITASLITTITLPIVMTIFSLMIGPTILTMYNVVYVVLGILLMLVYATLYAINLVAISLRTSIPGVMLDVSTIFLYIGGGLGVPVYKMPSILRYISLSIPYTHAAEITRYGVLGIEPYIGLYNEIIVSTMYLSVLLIITYIIVKRVTEYVRKHGARAIGVM